MSIGRSLNQLRGTDWLSATSENPFVYALLHLRHHLP